MTTRHSLLPDIGHIIAGLTQGAPAGSDNLALITELGDPAALRRVLEEILADDGLLGDIAARSYRHVNHFDKIVLVDSGRAADYRLTLHMWMPPYSSRQLDEELIHDHRFSFWSNILIGELRSINFDIVPDAQDRAIAGEVDLQTYRYRPEKAGTATVQNFYRYAGVSRLRPSEVKREQAGHAYYLRSSQIHRVLLPRRDMTCTLVLRGPREREYSSVYNSTYPKSDARAVNVMFSTHELRAKLCRLQAELCAEVP